MTLKNQKITLGTKSFIRRRVFPIRLLGGIDGEILLQFSRTHQPRFDAVVRMLGTQLFVQR
jgi:hypothetical protein